MKVCVPYLNGEEVVVTGGPFETKGPDLASVTFEETGSTVMEGVDLSMLLGWNAKKVSHSNKEKDRRRR